MWLEQDEDRGGEDNKGMQWKVGLEQRVKAGVGRIAASSAGSRLVCEGSKVGPLTLGSRFARGARASEWCVMEELPAPLGESVPGWCFRLPRRSQSSIALWTADALFASPTLTHTHALHPHTHIRAATSAYLVTPPSRSHVEPLTHTASSALSPRRANEHLDSASLDVLVSLGR